MRFEAKRDTAFSVPLLVPTGGALLITLWFVFKNPSTVTFLSLAATLLVFWGIYYFWTNTYYEIKEERLHYCSGFLKGSIPIKKITRVKTGDYPAGGNRPALSFKGLTILYGSGNELFISPIDQKSLIGALLAVNRKIKVKTK